MTTTIVKVPETIKLGTITALVEGPPGSPGKPGDPGSPGDPGKTSYEVWLAAGNNGSVEDYFNAMRGPGLTPKGAFALGATYELNDYVTAAGTATDSSLYFCKSMVIFVANLQPRSDPTNWTELAAPAGAAGKPIELQKTVEYIQWRVQGDLAWQNLVALVDIKGDPGEPGEPGKDGADGKSFSVDASGPTADKAAHDDAEAGFSFLDTTTGLLYIHGEGAGVWSDPIPFKGDPGTPGENGKNIELQKTATEIQWRVVGTGPWSTLVLLADLKGADGKNVEMQKGTTHIQWRVVGATAWTDLIAIADLTGKAGAVWYSGAVAPATSLGVVGDWYLNTATGAVLSKTASTTWTLQFTFPTGTGSGGGSTWLLLTADPISTNGEVGNWALNSTNSSIWQKANATTWNKVLAIPAFATQAQAENATLYDVISSPARVREFMEKFGFTAKFTTAVADLNTVVNGSLFNYNADTTHRPGTGGYGRGICIPSGDGYVTQLAIENDSHKVFVRYQTAGAWDATWGEVGASSGGGSGGGTTIPAAYMAADKSSVSSSAAVSLGFAGAVLPTNNTLYAFKATILTQGLVGGSFDVTFANMGAQIFRMTGMSADSTGALKRTTSDQAATPLTIYTGATQEGVAVIEGIIQFNYVDTVMPQLMAKVASSSFWLNVLKGSCYTLTPIAAITT